MKKIYLIIIFVSLLTSCSNLDDRFRKKFSNGLTNEQIDLILKINSDFDKFVIENNPEKSTDLKTCYAFMTDEINKKGDYSDYFYSEKKLIEIKKLINNLGIFDGNKNNYLNYIKELSTKDKEIKERFDYLQATGNDYLNSSFQELGFLSHNGDINSISKIILTFHFVVGQIIVVTTTANNS